MKEQSGPLLRKRYRRLDLIGRGGMASVYRGRDEALGREVAIKMYPPAADEREARRQESEVNVLAGLSHHSLVTLFDAGMDRSDDRGPRVYLVMELIHGTDLQIQLGRDGMSSEHTAHVGYDLAEALRYIHHLDVVHRDIKPSNILLVDYRDSGTRARAKLTDFGIVQYGGNSGSDEPTTGTAAYLSPEQVRRADIGPSSDVYSLGLVLLECFTGELAFPGDAIPCALARLERDPEIPDSIPANWRDVLRRMTARDPSARPTAHELVDLMRDLMIAETEGIRSTSPIARIETTRRLDMLDGAADRDMDRMARIAARSLRCPVAIISTVDLDVVRVLSAHGVEGDPAALVNTRGARERGFASSADVPLRSRNGYELGTLTVLDVEDRTFSADDAEALDDLAAMIVAELQLRPDARRAIDDASRRTATVA
jgi:serine/threonine protein kinase